MDKNLCSLLVTSCDSYEDSWEPFFKLFSIMWPDCEYPIYLNTESKRFDCDYLKIQLLYPDNLKDKKGKTISWSNRLRQAVEKIDSKYILFFLEDFYLMSPVRSDMVSKAINYMEENSDVVIVNFYRDPHESQIILDEFSYTKSSYDYAVNAMSAIWRKDFLLQILRDENPWDFEFFGTRRWRRTNYKILTHREEFEPVFDYKIKPALGYGIFQGKWLRKNPELFEKYGIEVDFEKRGFVDPPNLEAREREKNWLLNDVLKIIKSPKLIGHYFECVINVSKDKIRRFKAKYLNR